MLRSAVPYFIAKLLEYSNNPPSLCFSVDTLDGIVAGKSDTKSVEEGFKNDYYLDGRGFKGAQYLVEILPSLGWWVKVTMALSYSGYAQDLLDFEPVFEREKTKLLELLSDVLSSFAAALAENTSFSNSSSKLAPASIELLKRYRLYTRAVCDVAEEAWPIVDLDWLLKQA
jgi:hypothetical protein